MENKKTKKTRGLGKGLGALFENASIKEENFENSSKSAINIVA